MHLQLTRKFVSALKTVLDPWILVNFLMNKIIQTISNK